MQHEIIIKDLESINESAQQFVEQIGEHKLIALYAPMGTGKTTFTRAVCSVLGVESDAVSSPTFAIVNEYKTKLGESIYHFDFYRITKNEEALDIGLYDYLDSGSLCIMEWPENIAELLPEQTIIVRIEESLDGTRRLHWED